MASVVEFGEDLHAPNGEWRIDETVQDQVATEFKTQLAAALGNESRKENTVVVTVARPLNWTVYTVLAGLIDAGWGVLHDRYQDINPGTFSNSYNYYLYPLQQRDVETKYAAKLRLQWQVIP